MHEIDWSPKMLLISIWQETDQLTVSPSPPRNEALPRPRSCSACKSNNAFKQTEEERLETDFSFASALLATSFTTVQTVRVDDDAAIIKNAESAAPATIAKDVSVYGVAPTAS